MKFEDFLKSLTGSERNYISNRDYTQDHDKHKKALDVAINNGGSIDFDKEGYWFLYEVIELGFYVLEKDHEREFAACMGIVLKNIQSGGDGSRDIEDVIDSRYVDVEKLPSDLKEMIDSMIQKMINNLE